MNTPKSVELLVDLSLKGSIFQNVETRAFSHVYEYYGEDVERAETILTQDEVLVILGMKKKRALAEAKSIDEIASRVSQ